MIPITWNASDISAGVRDIRGKWVNSPYLRGGAVEWNPLTPAFLNDGGKWQTGESPVLVAAPRLATQPIRFVNGVSWDVHAGTSIAAAQNELLVSHPGASPVEGVVLEGRESQVLYRNAITDGIDIAVGVWHGRGPRVEHIYVIRRMPSGDSEFVEIDSHVTAIGSRVAGWDGASMLEIGNTSIVDRADDRRGWTLRPAVAWYYDAAGQMHSTPIVARMQLISRGNAKVTKFVPRSLIATALAARPDGELRCDLTGTFYPDANPETTTHDGQISNTTDPELWSTKNTESTGDAVDDSAQTCLQQCFTSTTTNRWGVWYRMFAGFDLASISGATVSAVDFTLTSAVVTKIETLASQTLSVAQMTPGSWTAAATSDWGVHCSATTRMASDINWSSIVDNGAANTFSFNSTGISAVQTAAGSRFGLSMKNGSELDNSEPTWLSNKRTRITWQTAEVAGTSSDPKLVVTYTAGGGGTGNNLLLLSVG